MKRIKVLLIALILVLGGVFFSSTYATEVEIRKLGAQPTRPFADPKYPNPKYQYTVPGKSGNVQYTIVKIYDDADRKDGALLYNKALYCLRGGVGFGAEGEDISKDPISYSEIGEMHLDAKDIIEKYMNKYKTGNEDGKTINLDTEKTFSISKNVNGKIETVQKEVNLYNAILWVIDEAYLPKDIIREGKTIYDAAQYRKELLDKAGVPVSQQKNITDNDIEVIQQLAMWYFTNYDEQEAETKPTVSQATKFPAQFLSINGENNLDFINNVKLDGREDNLNRLYQYFIYGAIENADTYKIDLVSKERTKIVEENKFDKTKPLTKTSNEDYYEVGPIKFKKNVNTRDVTVNTSDIVLYDAKENVIAKEFEIKQTTETPDKPPVDESGGKHIVYEFVDADGKVVTKLIKGQEYKVRIYRAFEEGADGYDMSKITVKIASSYSQTNAKFLSAGEVTQPVVDIEKEKVSEEDKISTEIFDLSLRKFITSITRNGAEVDVGDRTPRIDISKLNKNDSRTNKKITTATYTHPKNALLIETGDKVIYTIRVYNEGETDGTATEVTDYLPAGLELVSKEESTINSKYGWTSEDGKTIKTTYLKDTNIKAYDPTKTGLNEGETGWQKAEIGDSGLYYADIQVECKVVAQPNSENQDLRNIAAITADTGEDRDSIPGDPGRTDYNPPADNSSYKEDDDDYEDLVLRGKAFDLSLRKFITSIKRNGAEVEFADRTPKIDTTTLIEGTFDRNGNKEYTATYEHSKEPLTVKKGDIITYKIRIYNEGDINGYATEIKEHIPEGLAFINGYNSNNDNLWGLPNNTEVQSMKLVGEKGFYKTEDAVKNFKLEDFSEITSLKEVELVTGEVTVTTSQLDDGLIKAFDKNKTEATAEEGWQKADKGEGGLYYKDVEIACLVIAENTYKDVITNVAEISEDKDEKREDITDRDSTPNNKKDPYTTWQQDDDDYEPVVLKYFDLALRKFITGVETNGKTQDITSRNPKISIDEETGNIKYTHPKEDAPVEVANNDIVIYTIRVYNEGTIAGYAEEIADDIPEGLIYLPEHDINKKYEWKMFDESGKVTDKLDEAKSIKTDYLSEAKGKSENRDNLIDPFDPSKEISTVEPFNPDYRDVKVAFRVIEPNTSHNTIINSAQISEDSDDDEDSIPGEWNEGEDDQDREYIRLKYFDLSLLKWVTQTIVTVDGKTTTTETGFKPNTGKTETTGIRDNKENEPVAKVELDKYKLNKTTVKFVYKIRVTNEGEIAGYATEITDFIPKGLEFKAEDNKKYGWVKEGNDKVTTRALETVLLEPGKSAEVEIVFTWKKDKNNLGIKTNIAEITEDYNEHNSKDIDSTPNNKKDPYEKEQEDDDDFALVILSLKTGKGISYTLLITTVVTLLAGGIYLIKRYVLR